MHSEEGGVKEKIFIIFCFEWRPSTPLPFPSCIIDEMSFSSSSFFPPQPHEHTIDLGFF
jgi:hypothetical protein